MVKLSRKKVGRVDRLRVPGGPLLSLRGVGDLPPSFDGPRVHLTCEDQAFPDVDVVTIKIHFGTERSLPGIKQRTVEQSSWDN